MEKPVEPYPPWEWEYKQDWDEETVLHSCDFLDDDYAIDWLEDWKLDNEWEEGQPLPDTEGKTITLADILAKVPSDVPPENVRIAIDIDRGRQLIETSIIIKRPTDKAALQEQYKATCAEYELKKKQYEQDTVLYQKWQKEQDILELEKKLADLKK